MAVELIGFRQLLSQKVYADRGKTANWLAPTFRSSPYGAWFNNASGRCGPCGDHAV